MFEVNYYLEEGLEYYKIGTKKKKSIMKSTIR